LSTRVTQVVGYRCFSGHMPRNQAFEKASVID